MATFVGTLLIFGLCLVLMAAGPALSGRAMHRGCANKGSATPRCAACPRRNEEGTAKENPDG